MWLLWKNELDLGIYGQEIYSTCLRRALRGRGWRWRGDLPRSPAPRALFPLGWEEQSPRLFKGAWCKTSWPTTWPNRVGEISFLTSGIFPLQPWGSIPHQSPDTHSNSGIQITCVQINKWATGGREGGRESGQKTSRENVPVFQGKRGKRALAKKAAGPKQTSGWVSEGKTFSSWLMFPLLASAITSTAKDHSRG